MNGLEKAASEATESEPPWAFSEVYARLREDARAKIERDLEIGVKPLFWIDGEGAIRAADDGSFVRHMGDYVRVGDREMRRLEREIAEDEAAMTPEELAQERARREEFDARTDRLLLDEKIEAVEAEIAALNAALRAEQGGGVDS